MSNAINKMRVWALDASEDKADADAIVKIEKDALHRKLRPVLDFLRDELGDLSVGLTGACGGPTEGPLRKSVHVSDHPPQIDMYRAWRPELCIRFDAAQGRFTVRIGAEDASAYDGVGAVKEYLTPIVFDMLTEKQKRDLAAKAKANE